VSVALHWRPTVIRKHDMPFGAQLGEDGQVRFRLWAPNASTVDLVLTDSNYVGSMAQQNHGWFELITDKASSGSQYKFRIDGKLEVPDPASRFQPDDVLGPSQVWNPARHLWIDDAWHGREWEEAVLYELHIGAFTPEGTLNAATRKLSYLAGLGVTALELMPVADFFGKRNWGYDGVLPFAPDATYGSPDDLKSFIQSAHSLGLMVLLDVVYNHFGPEGNFLHSYAPQFFDEKIHTPWGAAINFGGPNSRTVRDFFIHNASYWLEEFHFDGLRFDAIHAIVDNSVPDFLTELATTVRSNIEPERRVHLILENDKNTSRYLERELHRVPLYTAQWNDDSHHAYHVLLTGENDGYYVDYKNLPAWHLGRCLAEGFSYQGEKSQHRPGIQRGDPSKHLSLTCFVNFLQNHDQIGNRAFGDRLHTLTSAEALRAAITILLLSPSPPLLFMGEEWASDSPFLFFCDFKGDLRNAVTEGRRAEFASFSRFSGFDASAIPDPNDIDTFLRSKLDWISQAEPQRQQWLAFHRELLNIRRESIIPLLLTNRYPSTDFEVFDERVLKVIWRFNSQCLTLLSNLSNSSVPHETLPSGRQLFSSKQHQRDAVELPPWFVTFFLEL
jgi:maltooligosyltrehalose trehalohydrolase